MVRVVAVATLVNLTEAPATSRSRARRTCRSAALLLPPHRQKLAAVSWSPRSSSRTIVLRVVALAHIGRREAYVPSQKDSDDQQHGARSAPTSQRSEDRAWELAQVDKHEADIIRAVRDRKS